MGRKSKGKALFLSVSILILLVLIYSAGSNKRTEKEGPSAAVKVIDVSNRASRATMDAFNRLEAWMDRVIAERAAKKEAEEIIESDLVYASVEEEIPINEEPNIEAVEEDVFVREDILYVPPFEILIPEGLKVPEKVGDTVFRKMDDYVYAVDKIMMYKDPACEGEYALISEKWQEFLRVGISEGCCYQLISQDGELLYADGTHFRRHREDMPLTESISLKRERIELPVEYISQFPTLTNGSEVTSLATVLSFLGYDISKDELASEFLPKGKPGKTNFYDAFIGDPTQRNSFGCYAGAIVKCADSYFESIESTRRATDMTGSSFKDVLTTVRDGNPVIVWIFDEEDREPELSDEWIVDGEYIIWKTGMHCVVVTGYDLEQGTVIVSDPMYGIKEYDLSTFIKWYKQFYSQAVVIYEE